jgi:hypothetical protein
MSEFMIAVLLFAVAFALKGEHAICIALIVYAAIFTGVLTFYSKD